MTKRATSTTTATTRRPKPEAAKVEKRAVITIEDLADFNDSLNLMVYGDSGVGKTPLAGQAPRAVFVSTEKGTISAKRFGSKAKLIKANTWEKLEAALNYLQNNPDEFDWVILDSVTKMQVLLMRHLLQVNVAENRKSADLDLPQLQDHQKWQNMFKRFIDEFIDLDINTLYIATAMHKEDAEGDELVLPHITGKDYEISQYVCAQMDAIYYLSTTKESRKKKRPTWVLTTQATQPYFAKDRFDAHERFVVDPSMVDIIKAIEDSAVDADENPSVAKRRATKVIPGDIIGDDESDEDDFDDEDEEEVKPARRKAVAATRKAKPAPPKDEEEDDDEDFDVEDEDEEDLDFDDDEEEDDDDEEEEEPPARKPVARKAAPRKAPARKAAKKKPEPEPDDDDDEDDDYDDDED